LLIGLRHDAGKHELPLADTPTGDARMIRFADRMRRVNPSPSSRLRAQAQALRDDPELELIVDPSLLENDELYFNAARLDRSMILKTTDYVTLAKPRLERIVASR
jgi:hypothetical protein